MKSRFTILIVLFLAYSTVHAQNSARSYLRDTLTTAGQVSMWGTLAQHRPRVTLGGRFIPQVNYSITTRRGLFDAEASANLNGSSQFFRDSSAVAGNAAPYRLWIRYSTNQLEVRAGLQKINFGSASMLRPLMWFEQVDPRDPLRITTGVWGLLGRYYFLNNANIWVWSLVGNDEPKTWEVAGSRKWQPEYGGRMQMPIGTGEAGLTFHHRIADTRGLSPAIPEHAFVPENRIAIDGKWDYVVGLWFEAAWISKARNTGTATNQEIINVGADYTFDVGNGLNTTFEQLLISYDQVAFGFNNPTWFSALSLSYPATLTDTFNAIVYYDWTSASSYNFINWKRQFNKFFFYLMAYWNPPVNLLPQQQGTGGTLFAGKGVQVMFVYNY